MLAELGIATSRLRIHPTWIAHLRPQVGWFAIRDSQLDLPHWYPRLLPWIASSFWALHSLFARELSLHSWLWQRSHPSVAVACCCKLTPCARPPIEKAKRRLRCFWRRSNWQRCGCAPMARLGAMWLRDGNDWKHYWWFKKWSLDLIEKWVFYVFAGMDCIDWSRSTKTRFLEIVGLTGNRDRSWGLQVLSNHFGGNHFGPIIVSAVHL